MNFQIETLGAGPDLVLLHGWGMNRWVWRPVAEALGAHYRLHLVDWPGVAGGETAGWCIQSMADALLGCLPPQFVPLGWSAGAALAAQLAIAAPARVPRFALVAANPVFVATRDWPAAMPRTLFEAFDKEVVADASAALMRFCGLVATGAAQPRSVSRFLRQAVQSAPPDARMLRDGLDWLGSCDWRQTLQRATQPVLLLAGEGDALVPPDSVAAITRLLARPTVAVIEAGGHAPFLAQPQQFINILLEWMHDGRV